MRVVFILLFIFAVLPDFIELSSPRNVGNNLAKEADHSPTIQATHPLASGPNLPLAMRLTTYDFPENLGLLTRGKALHYRKMLTGKIPILAVGDYAIARVQVQDTVVRGIFNQNRKRVKVHMGTKRVELMSGKEQIEFPIGNELKLPGLVENNPGMLVIRGRHDFPHDLVPHFFHNELQNNPNFTYNTQQKPPYEDDLNSNIGQSSRRSPDHPRK